jgi:DNA invertase Pin-like site-specific DNA recombinase
MVFPDRWGERTIQTAGSVGISAGLRSGRSSPFTTASCTVTACRSAICRVSKADGSQSTDLQRDALRAAGMATRRLSDDGASGRLDARPRLDAALKALRRGDTLIVWKLDRLGRDLRHLTNVVHDLSTRSIGFKVFTGHGASIDTTTSTGKLMFGIFASLAEFERDLISERT